MMILRRSVSFEAAHYLPNVAADHKCRRLHGHTYRLTIGVSGSVDPVTGMIVDFGDIAAAIDPIARQLDHRLLNEIDGLDNPTAENIARWLWMKLLPTVPGLREVSVRETERSECVLVAD
jgi:6-pyruvoyltetrahydropterin/6-carboxytetrahydropterin synthase